jgi:hypothetical protein
MAYASNIVANRGTTPVPQIVAPQIVLQRAQRGGNPNAGHDIAYTDPIITIDQTGLSYKQRHGQTGVEFSFDTGTLMLTLRQEVLISNALSNCAQQKWAVHENGHVLDNQTIMSHMDAAIRIDRTLQNIFNNQQWMRRNSFQATQRTIFNTVAAIFRRLTAEAAATRDTRAEYMRVHRDILQICPEPYIYEVNRSDTLTQIADFF